MVRRVNNIADFFYDVNRSIIRELDNEYIEDYIVIIKSLECGSLSIAPLGYGVTKMSFLYNSYVNTYRLREFMRLCSTSKKLSVCYDFKGEQGCLKSLVLTRDKVSEPFRRAKVFFRTVDLSKKIIPDLFLIRFILEECPNYVHDSLTLFISQGYLLPAAVANTYDTLLGLSKEDFRPSNKLHRKILSYIRSHESFDLNNHKRVMGGYFKLIEYKYKELNGIHVPPVYYKDCKVKLRGLYYGKG